MTAEPRPEPEDPRSLPLRPPMRMYGRPVPAPDTAAAVAEIIRRSPPSLGRGIVWSLLVAEMEREQRERECGASEFEGQGWAA